MKKIDEKELHEIFNEFKGRSQSAYNELYEKYYKLVYGIAFSVLKNKEDSEDITNEVFTKIYKLDKEKLPVSNEASWLFTVTRNECFSYLRKSRVNISIDEIYDIPSDSKEMQEIVDTEYYNKLISGLSEQEKTIVSLKVLSNFTFSKISQVMNIPIGTVQWKYYKAMNSLKVSVGGLIGAAIAFMLVVLRRENISNEKPYVNKNYQNESPGEIYKNEESATENAETHKSTDSTEVMDSTSASSTSSTQNISSATKTEESQKSNAELSNITTPDSSTEKNTSIISSLESSSEMVENTQKIDTFSILGIVIGIIFLIIFVIFLKKYQEKLHKKTSK